MSLGPDGVNRAANSFLDLPAIASHPLLLFSSLISSGFQRRPRSGLGAPTPNGAVAGSSSAGGSRPEHHRSRHEQERERHTHDGASDGAGERILAAGALLRLILRVGSSGELGGVLALGDESPEPTPGCESDRDIRIHRRQAKFERGRDECRDV